MTDTTGLGDSGISLGADVDFCSDLVAVVSTWTSAGLEEARLDDFEEVRGLLDASFGERGGEDSFCSKERCLGLGLGESDDWDELLVLGLARLGLGDGMGPVAFGLGIPGLDEDIDGLVSAMGAVRDFSGSTALSLSFEVGSLRFGPLARPFVICSRGFEPEFDGSEGLAVSRVLLDWALLNPGED